jgi:hypothetical protein
VKGPDWYAATVRGQMGMGLLFSGPIWVGGCVHPPPLSPCISISSSYRWLSRVHMQVCSAKLTAGIAATSLHQGISIWDIPVWGHSHTIFPDVGILVFHGFHKKSIQIVKFAMPLRLHSTCPWSHKPPESLGMHCYVVLCADSVALFSQACEQ